MDRLHFFVTTSDNYEPVFKQYRDSFDECGLPATRLHVHKYTMPSGAYGFQTDSWYHALTEKMRYFVRQLGTLHEDAVGLFTDADVQFFDNRAALTEVVEGMMHLDLDVVFMREHTKEEVNGGVLFVRNTPASRALLSHGLLHNEMRTHSFGEQDAFNQYLKDQGKQGGLRWQYLDTRKVVWGPHLPKHWKDVVLHHAVCAKSMERKLEQLQRVRKAYYTWRKHGA
jgi:hypothetical protein